jgi:hypothetical protein
MKKDTYNDIFAMRLLKNKLILRLKARIAYFFQNLIAKNHFAMTLYVIGSFFSALAARDRVNFAFITFCTVVYHRET